MKRRDFLKGSAVAVVGVAAGAEVLSGAVAPKTIDVAMSSTPELPYTEAWRREALTVLHKKMTFGKGIIND